MASDQEFYRMRADECAAEAAAATLDNVRDRALRSEAAWRVMADRQLHIAAQRAIAADLRSERLAAEADDPSRAAAELDDPADCA